LRAGYSSFERQAFIADMVGAPMIYIQKQGEASEKRVVCTSSELPLYDDGKQYMEAEVEFLISD
jgi:hypothetical protein